MVHNRIIKEVGKANGEIDFCLLMKKLFVDMPSWHAKAIFNAPIQAHINALEKSTKFVSRLAVI